MAKKAPKGKYAWTVKVGEKGQIVIPKEARDPVSYTHLDVYKRQVLYFPQRPCGGKKRSLK